VPVTAAAGTESLDVVRAVAMPGIQAMNTTAFVPI